MFSAINIPRGKFGFRRFFSFRSESLLFINSVGNAWFQDAVPEIDAAITSAQAALGARSTRYYGASMGAYGALLFALRRGDGDCLAFGPNIRLGLPGTHSARYAVPTDGPYADLTAIPPPRGHQLTVVFGTLDCVDMFAASLLFGTPGYRLLFARSVHNCHQHFHDLGVVEAFRDAFVEGRLPTVPRVIRHEYADEQLLLRKEKIYRVWSDFLETGRVDEDIGSDDIGDDFYRARLAYARKDMALAASALNRAIDGFETDPVLAVLPAGYRGRHYMLRAQAAMKLGDVARARSDLHQAIRCRTKVQRCRELLDALPA